MPAWFAILAEGALPAAEDRRRLIPASRFRQGRLAEPSVHGFGRLGETTLPPGPPGASAHLDCIVMTGHQPQSCHSTARSRSPRLNPDWVAMHIKNQGSGLFNCT